MKYLKATGAVLLMLIMAGAAAIAAGIAAKILTFLFTIGWEIF